MALLERETLDEEEVRLLVARAPLPSVVARGGGGTEPTGRPVGESPSTN